MNDSRNQFLRCALLIIVCSLPRFVMAQEATSVVEPTVEVFQSTEQLPVVEPITVLNSEQVFSDFEIIETPEVVSEIEYSNPIIECDADGVPIHECLGCGKDQCIGEEQCIVIKKSPLGCMEGISILPQDEVWMIDARDCLYGETDLSLMKVNQIVGNEMVERDLSQLTAAHASGDEMATVLYVHGNMTNKEFAIARGLQVYRNAFSKKAHRRGPVRYVIWAWKSEQETLRHYPDYLIKSERSLFVGETFAITLNQFSDRNMIVFGYSLGVQVILSAFDSPNLDRRDGEPSRYLLAFAAPAINAKFVACNSLSSWDTPVQQTCVFTNRKDRAIKAAQAIIRRQNPTKDATIAGLSEAGKLNVGPITAVDVFDETGRFHSIERYTRSDTLQSIMANLVNTVKANKSTPTTSDLTNGS